MRPTSYRPTWSTERVGETYSVTYNPAHRWYYAPEMRRDEALLLKSWIARPMGGRGSWRTPRSPIRRPQLTRRRARASSCAHWFSIPTEARRPPAPLIERGQGRDYSAAHEAHLVGGGLEEPPAGRTLVLGDRALVLGRRQRQPDGIGARRGATVGRRRAAIASNFSMPAAKAKQRPGVGGSVLEQQ